MFAKGRTGEERVHELRVGFFVLALDKRGNLLGRRGQACEIEGRPPKQRRAIRFCSSRELMTREFLFHEIVDRIATDVPDLSFGEGPEGPMVLPHGTFLDPSHEKFDLLWCQ